MEISEECRAKGAGVWDHINDFIRMRARVALDGPGVICNDLSRKREYFEAIIDKPSHPGRLHFELEDAEMITTLLNAAEKASKAQSTAGITLNLEFIIDGLGLAFAKTVVACECEDFEEIKGRLMWYESGGKPGRD